MAPLFFALCLASLPHALSFSLSHSHSDTHDSLTPIITHPGLPSATHTALSNVCLTRKSYADCEKSGAEEPEVGLDGVTAADIQAPGGAVNGIQRCIWCKGKHASRCFSVWR